MIAHAEGHRPSRSRLRRFLAALGSRTIVGCTDTEEMWDEGNVMLGFDAEERLIQKMPGDFAEKVVWSSRYPHHDTTSAQTRSRS